MASYRDALEDVARLIECEDCGLFGKEFMHRLAERVRTMPEPSTGIAVITPIDEGWQRFRQAYPKGVRNHWAPGRKAFEAAVNKRKHDIQKIIAGALNFAATNPEPQYVPAPAVFLNGDRFLTDYSLAQPSRRVVGLDDVEGYFAGRIAARN